MQQLSLRQLIACFTCAIASTERVGLVLILFLELQR